MQVDIKKLKPLGVVLILVAAVLALITCFTADMGVPPKYESMHSAEYYLQSEATMQELVLELEQHVFPNLDGITRYELMGDTCKLAIYIDSENYVTVEQVLLRDFDARLFEFFESR